MPKERPPRHRVQHRVARAFDDSSSATSVPSHAGQHQPDSASTRTPMESRAGSRRPAVSRAPRRAAAEREDAEFTFRRQRAKQRARSPDRRARRRGMRASASFASSVIRARHASRRHRRRVQRRFEHGGRVARQRFGGERRHAELEADHFALFGDAQAAAHRTRRLRQDRLARDGPPPRPTAPPRPWNKRNRTPWPLCDVDELFLRAVLRPRGRQLAGVLRRVGIADHDLQFAADLVPIPRNTRATRRSSRPRASRSASVSNSGTTGSVALDALRPQQQHHGEHVARRSRHRDDVLRDTVAERRRDHSARLEHFSALVGCGPRLREQAADGRRAPRAGTAAALLRSIPRSCGRRAGCRGSA